MRIVALASALAVLAACDGGPQFSHASTLHQDTRGVALADGDYARVGMSGTTCDVDTEYGSISTDYDYPGNDDTIHDVEGGKVAVTSDDGVHIVNRNPTAMVERQDYDLPVATYTDAVIIDDGVVVMGETPAGCHVDWAGRDLDASAVMKPEICSANPALAADPTLGTAWVGTPEGIYTSSPIEGEGTALLTEEGADLLVFDDTVGFMYAAIAGQNEVRALDLDGNQVWSMDVMGAVTDLADFGSRSSALVTVQYDDGSGSLLVLDGLTGQITSEMGTPDGNQRIASSEGGGKVALMRDSEVHFYNVFTWFPIE